MPSIMIPKVVSPNDSIFSNTVTFRDLTFKKPACIGPASAVHIPVVAVKHGFVVEGIKTKGASSAPSAIYERLIAIHEAKMGTIVGHD